MVVDNSMGPNLNTMCYLRLFSALLKGKLGLAFFP